MLEGVIMVSKVKDLTDKAGLNPHQLSKKTGITYRIVLGLYQGGTISPDVRIGTLQSIASVLGVKVDDLYRIEQIS